MGNKSCEEPILFNNTIKEAQKAYFDEDWENFKKIFKDYGKKDDLLENFDLFKNTAVGVAVDSDNPKLMMELLDMLSQQEKWVALTKQNCQGNTLLHKIAYRKKLSTVTEMVKVVLDSEKKIASALPPERLKLLEMKNSIGETPLFKAAKYGNMKALEYMAKQATKHMNIHLYSDEETILHACINGQYFDIACWIIEKIDCSSLIRKRNKSDLTCLQLLARMPAAFRSQYKKGFFTILIYKLLPDGRCQIEGCDGFKLPRHLNDLESAQDAKPPPSVLSRINSIVSNNLPKEFLVKNDDSWQTCSNRGDKQQVILPPALVNVAKRKKQLERKEKREELQGTKDQTHDDNIYRTPLFVATSNGIEEIVELYLKLHPMSIIHVSEDGQNILHITVKHRQLNIFRLLKQKQHFSPLCSQISIINRTVLHEVARMDYYRPSSQPGAAFQLQHELKWYKRVEKVVPVHLHLHCDNEKLTAGDVLDIEHHDMLADAQQWTQRTAESCSMVAVLVATVVFTAAYTIPGGNEGGSPVFLTSPVFIFFTIMDIVALAFSLASVVMFLSVLNAPFELWDFHKSLPRKLSTGFAFLFLALVSTMLAFSATILLTIRLQWKQWTSTLVYSAAFFPVTIFGLIQFPHYKKLPSLLHEIRKKAMKVINLIRRVKKPKHALEAN
ncbi:uncharacterized protein LOC129287271 isoform X2 [Prosopis cineraria]|uniref:uncharacterized protein LOC129287271 isoform X2 n=1 Tax=Prosopis cineraria TaxID=364024 RepID=UPI00240F4BFE|nr:uncharacterized protein LOC129287271 isoform X2 [Prosopis cineraria]